MCNFLYNLLFLASFVIRMLYLYLIQVLALIVFLDLVANVMTQGAAFLTGPRLIPKGNQLNCHQNVFILKYDFNAILAVRLLVCYWGQW